MESRSGRDQFLRAVVSKADKTITYILIYNIIISSTNWIQPYQGNYVIDGELITNKGVSIDTDVDCKSIGGGVTAGIGCTYRDDYGFRLKSEIFEEAKRLKDSGEQFFSYRIKTRASADIDLIINVEEILGLEQKIKAIIE